MKILSLVALLSLTANTWAATFSSPNGVTETCSEVAKIPEAFDPDYSDKDLAREVNYCKWDFYDTTNIALCPKTWSTSPATMVIDISKSGKSQRDYEAQANCGKKDDNHKNLAKLKYTMNERGASGTYSPSSLVYYHFSRFLNVDIDVPVAVYRTIDARAHLDRVSQKGERMARGGQNRAGWQWVVKGETNPGRYTPAADPKTALFTEDLKQIYGVLVAGGGTRYGAEINSPRKAGWGLPQSIEFQTTPAFLALRSERSLKDAIEEGLREGMKNAAIREDMGGGASDFQMSLWMKELTEIAVMDHIFSQQDRVGNIDYKWYVYWMDEAGKVRDRKVAELAEDENDERLEEQAKYPRSKMAKIEYPKTIDGAETFLVQRTFVNDNDAGVRKYANFGAKSEMVKNLRHISYDLYYRVQIMAKDFEAKGELYEYLASNFRIPKSYAELARTNALEVARILRETCEAGKLRFDLFSPKKILKGENTPITGVNCANPEKL